MKTADIKALELNVNVAGNRAALLEDFTAAHETAYNVYKELRALGQQLEDVKDSGIETLEQFEEQLADVESQLSTVTDRAAGKELLATKQDIAADIELQRTINAGSGNQLVQDITDKAVEFYAVAGALKGTFSGLRTEIVKTASTLTVKEDSRFILLVSNTFSGLEIGAKDTLKTAGIIKGHESSAPLGGVRHTSLNVKISMDSREQDVLYALERGASDLRV